MKSNYIKIPLLIIFSILVLGASVMFLWNCLVPTIFGLTSISFWQALGLFLLSRILFGGFGRGSRSRRKHGLRRNPIQEKWNSMTGEERQQFLDKRRRFGFGKIFLNKDQDGGERRNDNE